MLVLGEADVSSVLDMGCALAAVRASFDAVRVGVARDLHKQRVAVDGNTLHAIGAVFAGGLAGAPWSGAKIYVSGATHEHWVLVFDKDGLRALVSAGELGRLRTGAASGVSANLLASPAATTLGVLGSGRQAWTQVLAVAAVRRLELVSVWSRDFNHARSFAARITSELDLPAQATIDASAAVREHDIVVTISKAVEPILHGADVAPYAHVVLAGSSHAHRRESDCELFARADTVYVDDIAVAREHSGDLIAAVNEGAFDWAQARFIGDAVDHGGSGLTVFKSHGMGSWDLALAVAAVERAESRGVGVEISPGRN